jgi:hypothetical protein
MLWISLDFENSDFDEFLKVLTAKVRLESFLRTGTWRVSNSSSAREVDKTEKWIETKKAK